MLEIVSPRTNTARLSSAEHLFGTLAASGKNAAGPVSLEIVGDADRRRFLARASTAAELRRLGAQLGASYPQATLRPLDVATIASDPLHLGPDEQVAAVTLKLRNGPHLPLRTFDDRELDARQGSAQVDPLLGMLGALAELPTGWRAVSQLVVLEPARPDWAKAFQRLALERPLDQERRADRGPSLALPLALLGMIGLFTIGSAVAEAWSRDDWLQAFGLTLGTAALAFIAIVVVRFFRRSDPVDPQLVRAKLSRDATYAELRLAVVAPAFADSADLQARLDQLVAAYRPFALASGNSFRPHPIRQARPDLRMLGRFGPRVPTLLNVRELAGLWHLPQAGDDVHLVERTTATRRFPLPHTVAPEPDGSSCRIGTSSHQSGSVPVYSCASATW